MGSTAREGDFEAEKGVAMFVLPSALKQLQQSHQHEGLAIRAGFPSLFYWRIFYLLGLPLLFLWLYKMSSKTRNFPEKGKLLCL